jgi:hypothetical protein
MITFKPGVADVFAGQETEGAEPLESPLSLLNERFSVSLSLLGVGMQAASSSSPALQLLPADAFEVRSSSIAGAGNGLFSRVPIALGHYALPFKGTIYTQQQADGFENAGWYPWLQGMEAREAAHAEKERYGLSFTWPFAEPRALLVEMDRRQLWRIFKMHVAPDEYAFAMKMHRGVSLPELLEIVEGTIKRVHEQRWMIDMIQLEPDPSTGHGFRTARIELAAHANTRRDGDPEERTQLLESVARGDPWPGLRIQAPQDRSCRAKSWLNLEQWARWMGWDGTWLRVPANLHRAVEGYAWEPSSNSPAAGSNTSGWPIAEVMQGVDTAGAAPWGGWDGVLNDDCITISWFRVPLPLLQAVEQPKEPVFGGGLRELVLEYGRSE